MNFSPLWVRRPMRRRLPEPNVYNTGMGGAIHSCVLLSSKRYRYAIDKTESVFDADPPFCQRLERQGVDSLLDGEHARGERRLVVAVKHRDGGLCEDRAGIRS